MMLLNTKKRSGGGGSGGGIHSSGEGRIDFGAHQAIIVRNEESIDDLPEDMKIHPHIYTVAQSKGLEFEDVLLYNFFTDSTVDGKVWRCLDGYCDEQRGRGDDEEVAARRAELMRGEGGAGGARVGAAGAAGEDGTTTTRERRARLRRAAPEFDSRLHRCLEGELKDLYVAVTRARRKLWVFDDRSVSSSRRRRNGSTAVTTRILRERSDTMYDYLLRRSLVVADESMEVVVGDDGNKGGGAGSTLEAFDEGSTDEEWREQGLTFERTARQKKMGRDWVGSLKFLEFATKCYHKICPVEGGTTDPTTSEDLERVRLQHICIRCVAAQDDRKSSKIRRKLYLKCASLHLDVRPQSQRFLKTAARYVTEAGRLHPIHSRSRISLMKMAGKLFEVAGDNQSAISCLKETGDVVEASRLYESQGKYVLAAGLLEGKSTWDEQLELAKRYHKSLEEEDGGINSSGVEQEVVDQLLDVPVIARKKAEYWRRKGGDASARERPRCQEKVREAVDLFPSLEDKVMFLRSPGLNDVDNAVELLKSHARKLQSDMPTEKVTVEVDENQPKDKFATYCNPTTHNKKKNKAETVTKRKTVWSDVSKMQEWLSFRYRIETMLFHSGRFQRAIDYVLVRNNLLQQWTMDATRRNDRDLLLCRMYIEFAKHHRSLSQHATMNLDLSRCIKIATLVIGANDSSSLSSSSDSVSIIEAERLLAEAHRLQAEIIMSGSGKKRRQIIVDRDLKKYLLAKGAGALDLDLSGRHQNTYGACESMLLLLQSGSHANVKLPMMMKLVRDLLGLCGTLTKFLEKRRESDRGGSLRTTDLEWARFQRCLKHFGLLEMDQRQMSFYPALSPRVHDLLSGNGGGENQGDQGDQGEKKEEAREEAGEAVKKKFVGHCMRHTSWHTKMNLTQSLVDPDMSSLSFDATLALLLSSSLLLCTNILQCASQMSLTGEERLKLQEVEKKIIIPEHFSSSRALVFRKLDLAHDLHQLEELHRTSMASERLADRIESVLYDRRDDRRKSKESSKGKGSNNSNSSGTSSEDPIRRAMSWRPDALVLQMVELTPNDVAILLSPPSTTTNRVGYEERQRIWRRTTSSERARMVNVLVIQWNEEKKKSGGDLLEDKTHRMDVQLRISRQLTSLDSTSVLSTLWDRVERRNQAKRQSGEKWYVHIFASGELSTKTPAALLNSGKPSWTKFEKEDASLFSISARQQTAKQAANQAANQTAKQAAKQAAKLKRSSSVSTTDGMLVRSLQLADLSVNTSSFATSRATKLRGRCWRTRPSEISLIRCLAWRANYYETFRHYDQPRVRTEERLLFLERQLIGCLTLQARCSGRSLLQYFAGRRSNFGSDSGSDSGSAAAAHTSFAAAAAARAPAPAASATRTIPFDNDSVDGDLLLPESLYLEWLGMQRPDNIRWRDAAVEHHRRAGYDTLDYEHVARLTSWTLRQLWSFCLSQDYDIQEVKGTDDTCCLRGHWVKGKKQPVRDNSWSMLHHWERCLENKSGAVGRKAFLLVAIGMLNTDYLTLSFLEQDETLHTEGEHERWETSMFSGDDVFYADYVRSVLSAHLRKGDGERMMRVRNDMVRTMAHTHPKGSNEWRATPLTTFVLVTAGGVMSSQRESTRIVYKQCGLDRQERESLFDCLTDSYSSNVPVVVDIDLRSHRTSNALSRIIRESKHNEWRRKKSGAAASESGSSLSLSLSSSLIQRQQDEAESRHVVTRNAKILMVPPADLMKSSSRKSERIKRQEDWCFECLDQSHWDNNDSPGALQYQTGRRVAKEKIRQLASVAAATAVAAVTVGTAAVGGGGSGGGAKKTWSTKVTKKNTTTKTATAPSAESSAAPGQQQSPCEFCASKVLGNGYRCSNGHGYSVCRGCYQSLQKKLGKILNRHRSTTAKRNLSATHIVITPVETSNGTILHPPQIRYALRKIGKNFHNDKWTMTERWCFGCLRANETEFQGDSSPWCSVTEVKTTTSVVVPPRPTATPPTTTTDGICVADAPLKCRYCDRSDVYGTVESTCDDSHQHFVCPGCKNLAVKHFDRAVGKFKNNSNNARARTGMVVGSFTTPNGTCIYVPVLVNPKTGAFRHDNNHSKQERTDNWCMMCLETEAKTNQSSRTGTATRTEKNFYLSGRVVKKEKKKQDKKKERGKATKTSSDRVLKKSAAAAAASGGETKTSSGVTSMKKKNSPSSSLCSYCSSATSATIDWSCNGGHSYQVCDLCFGEIHRGLERIGRGARSIVDLSDVTGDEDLDVEEILSAALGSVQRRRIAYAFGRLRVRSTTLVQQEKAEEEQKKNAAAREDNISSSSSNSSSSLATELNVNAVEYDSGVQPQLMQIEQVSQPWQQQQIQQQQQQLQQLHQLRLQQQQQEGWPVFGSFNHILGRVCDIRLHGLVQQGVFHWLTPAKWSSSVQLQPHADSASSTSTACCLVCMPQQYAVAEGQQVERLAASSGVALPQPGAVQNQHQQQLQQQQPQQPLQNQHQLNVQQQVQQQVQQLFPGATRPPTQFFAPLPATQQMLAPTPVSMVPIDPEHSATSLHLTNRDKLHHWQAFIAMELLTTTSEILVMKEYLTDNVRMMTEYNLNTATAWKMMQNIEYGVPKLQEFNQFVQHWTKLGVWLMEKEDPRFNYGMSPINYCKAFLREKIALLKRNLHHVRVELEQMRARRMAHMQHHGGAIASMQQPQMSGGGDDGGGGGSDVVRGVDDGGGGGGGGGENSSTVIREGIPFNHMKEEDLLGDGFVEEGDFIMKPKKRFRRNKLKKGRK